jgi:type I restriction enzyme S subunit
VPQVPPHWTVRQLGRLGRLFKGNGGTKADEVAEGIPCIRYGDIYTQYDFLARATRSCVDQERASEYTRIRHGDILFAASGETLEEIGKSVANLIEGDACCGGDLIVFRPSVDADARFLGYATDCQAARSQKSRMGRGMTVMHIYGDQLKRLWIALPPRDEQRTIADFLDRETERIDTLVAKKQRLIELLQENRTALINHAVTRGLNPDAPMKDSGIEWFGRIPNDWAVLPLKRVASVRYGLGQPPAELAEGVPIVRATDVSRGVISKEGMLRVDPNDVPKTRDAFLATGEIIVVRSGAYTGDSAIVPEHLAGCVAGYDMVVRVRAADASFIGWHLLAVDVRVAQWEPLMLRAAQPHLNAEELASTLICCPPEYEQRRIAAHIARETDRLTELCQREKELTSLLLEYRSALITAAVTGQIDVREYAKEAN